MNISDLFISVDKLTVDEAKKIIDEKGLENTIILDVREPAEYEVGHIPGAVFMPLSKLPDGVSSLDLSKTVVTYCKRGPRSRSAAALLKRHGGDKVYYMDGGIDAWNGFAATGQYEAGHLLLEGKESFEDCVAIAWSLEDCTGLFYEQVKDLLDDIDAKKVFNTLIMAEDRHKSKLMEAYQQNMGEAITGEKLKEISITGYIEGGISMDETLKWLKRENSTLQDVLEICMQIEINSLDLYTKMYREIEDEKAKKVFSQLIDEEKIHLASLGKLFGSWAVN